MTEPLVQTPPAESHEPPVPFADTRVGLLSPHWPLRLSMGLALYLVLVAAVLAPQAVAGADVVQLAVLLLPAFAVAAAGRVVFAVIAAGSPPGAAHVRVLASALAAGALVSAMAALVAGLVGASEEPLQRALAGVLVAAVLAGAAALRSLELRLGAAARRLFFVGSAEQLEDLAREVGRRGDMQLVGSLVGPRHARSALMEAVSRARPTTLIVSSEASRDESLVSAASELHLAGLRVRALNDFYEQRFGKVALSELSHAWFLFDVAEIHGRRTYRAVKRVLEGAIAGVVLVLMAPVLLGIAVAVKVSSPGPVLFRQRRVGRDRRIVTLTKFRTMTVRAEDARARWATEELTRITPLGRRLRKYRLDELPQLWHVVRGDLALVGPRPEQPELVERCSERIEFYSARHRVRPGLTGWAQVNSDYGGSLRGTLEKLQYDFFYIKRQSLRLDLLILVATIRTVLSGRGS